MNEIAEKDKTIFNLNKQLANMQILLQAKGILSVADDEFNENITDEIDLNENLSELHGLAIKQSK